MARQQHLVLARNPESGTVAIGPVYTDLSVKRLRDRVAAAGWEPLGTAQRMSVTQALADLARAQSPQTTTTPADGTVNPRSTARTDLTDILTRRALDRVLDLLEDAADAGATEVTLDNLRAVIGPAALRQPPAPVRAPQPGDEVLIGGTVQPDTDRAVPAGHLIVQVPAAASTDLVINADTVHEVLSPRWWPPRRGDEVRDSTRDLWKYDGALWRSPNYFGPMTTDDLLELLGPVDLVARVGRRPETGAG